MPHKVLLPWKITLELFVQRTLFQHTQLYDRLLFTFTLCIQCLLFIHYFI